MTCRRRASCMGLEMKSFMPEIWQSLTLASSEYADKPMIGLLKPDFLMSRVASRPSMLGIWTSMNIKSYSEWLDMLAWTILIAFLPSSAISTFKMFSILNIRKMTIWFVLLSSATRIFNFRPICLSVATTRDLSDETGLEDEKKSSSEDYLDIQSPRGKRE